MRVQGRRFVVPGLAFVMVFAAAAPVRAAAPPSLRLIVTSHQVTAEEGSRGRLDLNLGLWIAPVGGSFEIRMGRPDYPTPPTASQTESDGTVLREVPLELLDTWWGLASFLHISIKDESGRAIHRSVDTFCPNGWDVDRLDDSGVAEPTYPTGCWVSPWILGTVWGIDDGWATNASPWLYVPAREFAVGTYQMRIWIDPAFVDLFEIAPEDAEQLVTLDVVPKGSLSATASATATATAQSAATSSRALSAPEIVPTADVEPDMAALPAFEIHLNDRRTREYLTFASTVWNAGPAPLLVEGYRQGDQDVMDAWQFFTDDTGAIVGKASAGDLTYDARPGHRHWHFEQFTDYALVDETKTEAIMSEKQSFCLGPTDPIDLLVPRAEWNVGWGSACGDPDSLWVRESLPAGWGDTYFQWLPGQSFDVTDLPPGRYYIRVHVNPLDELFDASGANDVSYRRIRLHGEPGAKHRWVTVPPYQGIDTEGCWGCGVPAPAFDGVVR